MSLLDELAGSTPEGDPDALPAEITEAISALFGDEGDDEPYHNGDANAPDTSEWAEFVNPMMVDAHMMDQNEGGRSDPRVSRLIEYAVNKAGVRSAEDFQVWFRSVMHNATRMFGEGVRRGGLDALLQYLETMEVFLADSQRSALRS